MSLPASAPTDPIVLHTEVIPSDDGFRWRIRIWVGNVDVRNTAPAQTIESPATYGSRRIAGAYLARRLLGLIPRLAA